MPDLTRGRGIDGDQERKEKPKRVIVEIGADEKNSCIKQYNIQLPPDTAYQIVNVDYDILPNELDDRQVIPLENESVDEIWLSNVLSDLAYFNMGNQERIDFYLQVKTQSQQMESRDIIQAQSDAALFQKMRTLKDILRVLKEKGVLRIYENYTQYHPDVVSKILKWLQENPQIEFSEDLEEEKRIQPILDKENQDKIDFYKKYEPFRKKEDIFLSRKYNKVYKVVKKPPL